jgi:hypothetical protein
MLADRDLQAENINKFIQPGLAIADKYYDKWGTLMRTSLQCVSPLHRFI